MEAFTLQANPGTDIWRKPPTTNVFNAPTRAAPGTAVPRGPLSAFRSARISFAFPYAEQYDQAGLLLSLRPARPSPAGAGAASSADPPPKWIKTGVEYYNGAPMVSTVACDAWADWSVTPLVRGAGTPAGDGNEWTTVSVVREADGNGMGVWVYQLVAGADGTETKVPLREICWVFGGKSDDWELTVEAMAARPEKASSGALHVEFAGFEVVWAA